MSMNWFRSHHGAPTDPKWITIARRAGIRPGDVAAIIWALLDYASQNDDRGSIDGHDSEMLADFFGYETAQIDGVKAAMIEKHVIVNNRFSAWDKRQPAREDVTAAERKRSQRERERRERDGAGHCVTERDITHGHGTDKIREDKIREDKRNIGGASAPTETPFGFIGKVIRLKQSDYDEWRKTYCHVPDIDAELQAADCYYAENPPKDGKWFFPVSNWLKRAHEQNKPPPKRMGL